MSFIGFLFYLIDEYSFFFGNVRSYGIRFNLRVCDDKTDNRS